MWDALSGVVFNLVNEHKLWSYLICFILGALIMRQVWRSGFRDDYIKLLSEKIKLREDEIKKLNQTNTYVTKRITPVNKLMIVLIVVLVPVLAGAAWWSGIRYAASSENALKEEITIKDERIVQLIEQIKSKDQTIMKLEARIKELSTNDEDYDVENDILIKLREVRSLVDEMK